MKTLHQKKKSLLNPLLQKEFQAIVLVSEFVHHEASEEAQY